MKKYIVIALSALLLAGCSSASDAPKGNKETPKTETTSAAKIQVPKPTTQNTTETTTQTTTPPPVSNRDAQASTSTTPQVSHIDCGRLPTAAEIDECYASTNSGPDNSEPESIPSTPSTERPAPVVPAPAPVVPESAPRGTY